MELLEEALDGAVIKCLSDFAGATGLEQERAGIGNPEGKGIDDVAGTFGVEAGKHHSMGAEQAVETGQDFEHEGAGEVFEDVPNEDGIEAHGSVLEDLIEEALTSLGGGLRGGRITGTEDGVGGAQEVLEGEAVTQAGNELDVGLGELAQVEHIEAGPFGEDGKELFETVAGPNESVGRGRGAHR